MDRLYEQYELYKQTIYTGSFGSDLFWFFAVSGVRGGGGGVIIYCFKIAIVPNSIFATSLQSLVCIVTFISFSFSFTFIIDAGVALRLTSTSKAIHAFSTRPPLGSK